MSDRPAATAVPGGTAAAPAWRWARFEDLGVDDLHDALALRVAVFVVEQQCPYAEVDGLDRHAWHLLGRDGAGQLQAYLRVLDPGCRHPEPSIGRVVTRPERRGTGLGRALLREGLAGCARLHPGLSNRIGAQQRLQGLYESLGWRAVGPAYLEDGIVHVEMLRPADGWG